VQQHVAAGLDVIGAASSISLWLMPSLHGMKIMPAGARRAMYTASWPAPLTASMAE
jgi:hypothetical protein